MNSLGSSSKWPCYDSPPSASSFLLRESYHTEGGTDILSGERYSRRIKCLSANEVSESTVYYIDFPGQSDELHSRSKCDKSKHCQHPNSAFPPEAVTLGSSLATPGDLAFAQKCADLHRFIHPLLELLHGLKIGRYVKGLTGFQQSVAIDRLQRILGIIQKPEMGEKYLQNLLQIEIMLKMWFPQVTFQCKDTPNQTTTPRLRHNWHQNQLHMPVKKRKLSWSNPEPAGKVPTKQKHHQHEKHGSCLASTLPHTVSTCLPGLPKRRKILEEEMAETSGNSCSARQEFTDITGALSRPYVHNRRQNESREQSPISLPSPSGSPATQDSSVSSSDTVTTDDSP